TANALSRLSLAMWNTMARRSARAASDHSTRPSATLALALRGGLGACMQIAAQLGKHLFVRRHPSFADIRFTTSHDLHHGQALLLLAPGIVTLHHGHATPVLGQHHGRLVLQALDPAAGVAL